MTRKMITTSIKCENIAPIKNLTKEIKSGSLRMGVFASNGSGKTFLSRLFRLTENQEEFVLNENGESPTDKLLTIGKDKAAFSFKVKDKNGDTIEDFSINLKKGETPIIPDTKYLYHTFNQDYVEDNIQAFGYDKDSDIQGYILGKVNIDLKEDEDRLSEIEKEGKRLRENVEKEINTYVGNYLGNIPYIKSLAEYKDLNFEVIFSRVNEDLQQVSKSIDELLTDYDKVKSVPSNLVHIGDVDRVNLDFKILDQLKNDLNANFSLSSLAEGFKQKIKNKQEFVEDGIKLLSESEGGFCPFCEQILQESALNLIDNYTKYLADTEAKTIKQFKGYLDFLTNIINHIKTIENINSKRINVFNEYKTKYIPSSEKEELGALNIAELQNVIESLCGMIEEKLKDISLSISVDNLINEKIKDHQTFLNGIIDLNNENISRINTKIDRIEKESQTTRRDICKSAYNYLVNTYRDDFDVITQLRKNWSELSEVISKKKEQEKVSKKSRVASTIKSVLNYFFSDKYTLDEETFRLIFHKNTLERDQAKDVLSQGEKNIVAFAYYLGDTHLKVEKENEYEKLFFIIDDPISSMDFTHVYTLCGVIRNISSIIDKINRERVIVFTHNNDFMRILAANRIIDKKLLLRKGELKDFNNNLTVPYINHLLDVYNVARNNEVANHTTANSIRHIIETLAKFQNIDISKDGIDEYIKANITKETKSYTLINDLSHGGWRSEQPPLTEEDYKAVCETVIKHIEKDFSGQIEYCRKIIG